MKGKSTLDNGHVERGKKGDKFYKRLINIALVLTAVLFFWFGLICGLILHNDKTGKDKDSFINDRVLYPNEGEVDVQSSMNAETDFQMGTEMVAGLEEDYDPTEGGIHRYSYYASDGSWDENFEQAKAKGGYLLRVNSQDEYDYIVGALGASDLNDIFILQIGARRDPESSLYYWVDENNNLYGDPINDANSWIVDEWMQGEPSYQDSYGEKTITEDKVVLYLLEGKWYLNDVTNGMVAWYPPHAGKVGYIVEFED